MVTISIIASMRSTLMSKGFLPNPEEDSSIPAFRPALTPSKPEREPVQILVIGSSQGVTNIIQSLYSHRFAQISEWSILMPAPIPGKLMQMLIRHVPIN